MVPPWPAGSDENQRFPQARVAQIRPSWVRFGTIEIPGHKSSVLSCEKANPTAKPLHRIQKAGGGIPHRLQWALRWEGPFQNSKPTISGPVFLLTNLAWVGWATLPQTHTQRYGALRKSIPLVLEGGPGSSGRSPGTPECTSDANMAMLWRPCWSVAILAQATLFNKAFRDVLQSTHILSPCRA